MNQLIAVYGSLKAKCHNHIRFGLDKEKFIGDSTVLANMYNGPGYPYLYLNATDNQKHIPIEIYEVSQSTFDTLDAIEQGAGYIAKRIKIKLSPESMPLSVWIWEQEGKPSKQMTEINNWPPLE